MSNTESSAQTLPKPSPRLGKVYLTERQAEFCRNYADIASESFQNAQLSAKLAGFTGNRLGETGHALLKHPKVIERINELELEISSGIDWTRDVYQFEILKCYREVSASSVNKPRYLEMIGKVKGFLEPATTNTFIFANMDRDSIMSRVSDIASRLRVPLYKGSDAQAGALIPQGAQVSQVNSERESEGVQTEAEGLKLSTPPPLISPISSLEVSNVVNEVPPAQPEEKDSADDADDVAEKSDEKVSEPAAEPTWSGCKHDLKLADGKWSCAKCGYVHED